MYDGRELLKLRNLHRYRSWSMAKKSINFIAYVCDKIFAAMSYFQRGAHNTIR